jgi:DNA-binding transcriptional MocR family regulator
MRDLVAHDHLPSAFLIYLFLRGRATADQTHERSGKRRMHLVTISVRELAAETGLAKSVVQTALKVLQRRELLRVDSRERTGQPARPASYQVLRPWRKPVPRKDVN